MEYLCLCTVQIVDVQLLGLKLLTKLKRKNRENAGLAKAIDQLIKDIKEAEWKTKEEVIADRPDADRVHSDGFYFFDMNIHRTMTLIEFCTDDENGSGTVRILWTDSHDEYERTFRNNKSTINKWLKKPRFNRIEQTWNDWKLITF